MSKARSLPGSFKYALRGIRDVFKNEPNFKIHTLAAGAAIAMGFLLNISLLEWVVLIVTIAFVLVVEILNTAIEKIVDAFSPQRSETARAIKDISAAAVLISAAVSLIVGKIIFFPRVLELLNRQ